MSDDAQDRRAIILGGISCFTEQLQERLAGDENVPLFANDYKIGFDGDLAHLAAFRFFLLGWPLSQAANFFP